LVGVAGDLVRVAESIDLGLFEDFLISNVPNGL